MTRFRTNIDCCQRFMSGLSNQLPDYQQQVGDIIVVYVGRMRDYVEMKVIARRWDEDGELTVELHMPGGFATFTHFENWVKKCLEQ